jgi:hypothetical protein
MGFLFILFGFGCFVGFFVIRECDPLVSYGKFFKGFGGFLVFCF